MALGVADVSEPIDNIIPLPPRDPPPPANESDYGAKPKRSRRKAQPDSNDPTLPLIQVTAGHLDQTATAGESALIASAQPIYQRGRSLVRPFRAEVPASKGRTTTAAGLVSLDGAATVDRLCRAARWERYDARAQAWVRINPPANVAATILSRIGEWRFPSIAGVITTPTLRPDGSVLTAPGYDAATRLYHVTDKALDLSPYLPERPTRDDAMRALAELRHLLKNFPTVSEVDHAVALSALISPVVRGACPVVPLHAVRASTAGTGKSFLVDVASAIASGRLCPVMTVVADAKETDARITGMLIAGRPLICLDNVNGELGSDLLCQAIERPLVDIRPLGTSDMVEIESRASFYATGNSLRVRGDMTRRTIQCNLDAGLERPELRTFEFDPVEAVLSDRARFVAACLCVTLAFISTEQECEKPLASFQEWSRHVRSPLIWLGCADPCVSMEEAREDDPELGELRDLLDAWVNEIGDTLALTVSDIIEMIGERFPEEVDGTPAAYKFPRMREVILRYAPARKPADNKSIGNAIRLRAGRIYAGYRLVKAGKAHGNVVRWQVQKAK